MREAIAEKWRGKSESDGVPTAPISLITCFLSMPLPSPDNLADRNIDSTDTELRYAAYGARLRTALRAGHRYLAYVRPLSHLALLMIHFCFIRPVMSEKPSDPSYLPLS